MLASSLLARAASAEDVIASHIRPNDLKGDVSFLASDALEGRAAPQRGLDIAAVSGKNPVRDRLRTFKKVVRRPPRKNAFGNLLLNAAAR